MLKKFIASVAVAALAACQPAPAARTENAAATAAAAPVPVTEAWLGTWTGVEGTTLTIDPGAPGKVFITGLSLDGPFSFEGAADGDVIRFERNGVQETIRSGDGAATGLKYLDGKTDCLVIRDGEGFCRD